jgi:hypothetical protein
LNEQETTEENGVQIHIPVASGDIPRFVMNARSVYRFFDVKPNITGNRVEFDYPEPLVETSEFSLLEEAAGLPGRINVVMGQVCYSADGHPFEHKFGHNGVVILHVPIGDCSFAVSREELQYNKKTVVAINAALKAAGEESAKRLANKVGSEKSRLGKIQAARRFQDLVKFDVKLETVESDVAECYATKRLRAKGKKLYVATGQDFRPSFETTYTFILQDDELTQTYKNRLRYWIDTNNIQNVVLVRAYDDEVVEETFGKISLKMSELEAVPVQRVGSTNRNYIKELAMGWTPRRQAHNWKPTESVNADNACVVKKKNTQVWLNGKLHKPDTARVIARALGFDRVYGVAPCRYNALVEDTGS